MTWRKARVKTRAVLGTLTKPFVGVVKGGAICLSRLPFFFISSSVGGEENIFNLPCRPR
jgi:hypothetical protein